MDLITIGKFIKQQRKEKGLTQAMLAEKLSISEKTVSKWECGNGFPDTALMLPLCDALGICANDLLSGKKLEESEYKKNAEQNLVELKCKQQQSTKFLLTLECVLGFLCTISFLVLVFIASFSNFATIWKVLIILFAVLQFITGIHFCLLIEKDAGYYECQYCHHKYIPTYKQVFLAGHAGRTRHMKCPECGKKSWQKKVIK